MKKTMPLLITILLLATAIITIFTMAIINYHNQQNNQNTEENSQTDDSQQNIKYPTKEPEDKKPHGFELALKVKPIHDKFKVVGIGAYVKNTGDKVKHVKMKASVYKGFQSNWPLYELEEYHKQSEATLAPGEEVLVGNFFASDFSKLRRVEKLHVEFYAETIDESTLFGQDVISIYMDLLGKIIHNYAGRIIILSF